MTQWPAPSPSQPLVTTWRLPTPPPQLRLRPDPPYANAGR
jgi:hypothetical protein